MKVTKERDAFLLDFEVLQHLRDIQAEYNWSFSPEEEKNRKRKRFTGAGADLEAITRDVSQYLEGSAAGQVHSAEAFAQLMAFLNGFDLVKVEKLQIVNSLPRSMVHLYALVEECGQRFSEETCEGIIAKISELFPPAMQVDE